MCDSEIIPSLNEIGSLAKRAVRGAGRSWGIAEEAASSVRWLSTHKLPGAVLLAGLLSQQEVDAVHKDDACPLLAAAALSDNAACWQYPVSRELEILELAYPLLLVPTVARVAAMCGVWLQASWDNISISTDGQSVCVEGPLSTLTVDRTPRFFCSGANDRVTLLPTSKRQAVDRDSWDVLESFAHRTYAPASEVSRLLGAGDGNVKDE